MDESGNTGTKVDPAQPVHLIGCLLVEDVAVRPFEEALDAVAAKHFQLQRQQPRFEFHGKELHDGKGLFKGVPVETRLAAAQEIIDAAQAHATAWGYAGVDKVKSNAADHPHRIAFTLLVEGLQDWLRKQNALGLIIADENHEVSQQLIDDFAIFKEFATKWGYRRVPVTNIVDSVHFVQSHNNRIIQACDVITYIYLKAHRLFIAKRTAFDQSGASEEQWPAWRAQNTTASERATMNLGERIDQITWFRRKIWPA